jgi:hypothetical protein
MSNKAWRRLATAVAVPASALGALAGFAAAPAKAGTAQQQMRPTPSIPNETFRGYGMVHGNDIPVIASGVFGDRGYLNLTGNGRATVALRHGSIYVRISHDHDSMSLNQRSCTETSTENFSYRITGGSQRYRAVRGTGRGFIKVTEVVRRHHGICAANQPIPSKTSVKVDAVAYVR